MKNRLVKILSISAILILILSISTCALAPRWSYLYTITPELSKSSDTYRVTVSADPSIIKIEAELELYKKGLFGIYTKKSTSSGTINNYYGIISGSYDMSTNDEYKVVAEVTVTTSSGQTETATVEHAE